MSNWFPSPGTNLEDILRLDYVTNVPIDKKETTQKENYFLNSRGTFDIELDFGAYNNVVSVLSLHTVRQFFQESGKRVLVVIEYGNYKRAGFIARETMEFNYSYAQGHDSLRFTCTGIIGEFINYLSTKPLPDYPNTNTQQVTFNEFMVNGILENITQTNLTVSNELDIISKVGSQVYLSTPIYNDIRKKTTGLNDLNKWILFSDVCNAMGIKFDLECTFVSPSNNGSIGFTLYLKWRTDGGTIRNFDILEHKKGYHIPESKKWVMVRDREFVGAIQPGGGNIAIRMTLAAGILYNKDEFYHDNPGYSDVNNWFVLSAEFYRADTQEILQTVSGIISRITVNGGLYYFTEIVDDINNVIFLAERRFPIGDFIPLIAAGVVPLVRIFVKSFTYTTPTFPPIPTYVDNTEDILENTTKAEYGFLLTDNEKQTKRMKFDFPIGSDVSLYDKFNLEGSEYSIERLEVDYLSETLTTDLIQI